MKILSKLSLRSLLLNKQRSIVTIIGIILSGALITAVASMITSFMFTMQQDAINTSGNRHITFFDVPKEEVNYLINHKETKEYYLSELLYNVKETDNDDEYFTTYNVSGATEEALADLEDNLIEGRLPQNDTEIVISEYLTYDYNIGEKIKFDKGTTYCQDGDEKFICERDFYANNIELESSEIVELTVVGYISYSNYQHHTLITKIDEISDRADISILYNNPENYKDITYSILGIESEFETGKYEYSYNSQLLSMSGYTVNDGTMEAITALASIVFGIIILSSIFCIRNSFAISANEKIRQYGMIRSIGATPRQIRKTIFKEGFYLGIIAIPLGIIFGLLAAYILVLLVNSLLAIEISTKMIFKVNYLVILLSIILSILTIYLSSIGTAIRVSRISEIDAIKNRNEIKIKKKKKLKVPKIIKSIFKNGGVIAYKNMKRNKSKFRTTIISITISVITFISLSYFLSIGFTTANNEFESSKYSYVVFNSDYSLDDKTKEQQFMEILKLDGAGDDYFYNYEISFLTEVTNMSDESEKYIMSTDDYSFVSLVKLDENTYNDLLKEINLDNEELNNTGLLFNNNITVYDGNEELEINAFKDNLNSINLHTYNSNSELVNTNKSLDIKYIDKNQDLFNFVGPTLIINEQTYNELKEITDYTMISNLYLNPEDNILLTEEIDTYEDINDNSFYIDDYVVYKKMIDNVLLLISIFLYGFITVITLIGVTNIFNTITTNINLRSKEFAILKSIGMTKKELINMIKLESFFYCIKSLIIGIPLGVLLSYLMYSSTSDSLMEELKFVPPYEAILIAIIFVFIIIYLIMRLSINKINKQNIIETIRNENI